MTADRKTSFAALPVRVIGDPRLSALEIRVLACIAFHDRMSGPRGKGQGAWASNETLATRVGCHYTRLSSAVTKLAQLGYLEREPHPLNKRLRVYRVRYEAPPDTLQDGKPSASPTVCETANHSAETLCGAANEAASTVCRPSEISQENQSDDTVEYIPRSDVRYSAEAGKENSAEAARLTARMARQNGIGEGLGALLAQIERVFRRQPHRLSDSELEEWVEWLGFVSASTEVADPELAWATRLAEEIGQYLDDQTAGDEGRRAAV